MGKYGYMDPFAEVADGQLTRAGSPRSASARTRAALVVVCSVFALTSCAASGPTYAVFERDSQAVDELPEALTADAGDHADLATARFAGEHDGTSLWLTRGNDSSAVCLLAYQDESTWLLGCGGQQGPVGVSGVVGDFTLVPNGVPGPDGATKISENVYAASAD